MQCRTCIASLSKPSMMHFSTQRLHVGQKAGAGESCQVTDMAIVHDNATSSDNLIFQFPACQPNGAKKELHLSLPHFAKW